MKNILSDEINNHNTDTIGKNVEEQHLCKEDVKWTIVFDDVRSSLKKYIKKNSLIINGFRLIKVKKYMLFLPAMTPCHLSL